jgi:hypothetical protein
MNKETRARWKKRLWLLLLVVAVGVGVAGGWYFKPHLPPPPPLPPEVIEVEVVKEIPVLVEGPERVKIVERIKWKTRTETVEKEVIKEVEKVVEKAAEVGTLQAQVNVDADKYEGVNAVGTLAFGWKGTADCQIRAATTDPWTVIARSPFDLTASYAQTTQAPEEKASTGGMRVEARAGVHSDEGIDLGLTVYPWAGKKFWRRIGFYGSMQSSSLEFYNPSQEIFNTLDARYTGGVAITFGKL